MNEVDTSDCKNELRNKRSGMFEILVPIFATVLALCFLQLLHQPWNGLDEISNTNFRAALNKKGDVESVEYGSGLRTLYGKPVVIVKFKGLQKGKFCVVTEDTLSEVRDQSKPAEYKRGYYCTPNLTSIEDQYLALGFGLIIFLAIKLIRRSTPLLAK